MYVNKLGEWSKMTNEQLLEELKKTKDSKDKMLFGLYQAVSKQINTAVANGLWNMMCASHNPKDLFAKNGWWSTGQVFGILPIAGCKGKTIVNSNTALKNRAEALGKNKKKEPNGVDDKSLAMLLANFDKKDWMSDLLASWRKAAKSEVAQEEGYKNTAAAATKEIKAFHDEMTECLNEATKLNKDVNELAKKAKDNVNVSGNKEDNSNAGIKNGSGAVKPGNDNKKMKE